MTIREIAEKTHKSTQWIYYLQKQLGRTPTVDEVLSRSGRKGGRPKKAKTKE